MEDIVAFLGLTVSILKSFKDTDLKQVLSSLRGGTLENTLTVPLRLFDQFHDFTINNCRLLFSFINK